MVDSLRAMLSSFRNLLREFELWTTSSQRKELLDVLY